MKLQKLIIQNFRVFHGVHEFDFKDKSLIILDGPNGHGKSSIFDAIQWCLTGDIQRYRGTSEPQNFNYLINNESFKKIPITMKVEIWLSSGEGDKLVKITRSLRKTKSSTTPKIYIDGKEYKLREGNESIKNILVNKDMAEGVLNNSGNIEDIDFVRFFSTSQLLSQDELRSFVQSTNPRDRFRVLENLLGLKRYGVHFRTYLNDINEILREKLLKSKGDLDEKQKDYVRISTKLQAQTELMQRVGNTSEEQLIQKINELMITISLPSLNVHTIEKIDQNSQMYLISIRNDINNIRDTYEANTLTLRNSLSDLKSFPVDYKHKKEYLDKRLRELKEIQTNRAMGLERCKIKLANLDVVKQQEIEFQSITKAIHTLETQSMQLQGENEQILNHNLVRDLKKEFLSHKEFQFKYLQVQENLSNILQIKTIRLLEDSLTDFKVQLSHHQTQKQTLETETTSLQKEIDLLNTVLLTLEKERESQKTDRINQLVYEIQQFLLQSKEQKSCIVCGSTFSLPETLHSRLYKQMEYAENQRTEIEQKYIKHVSEKKVLEEKHSKNTLKLKETLKEIEGIQIKIHEVTVQIEKLKIAVTSTDFFNIPKEQLYQSEEEFLKFTNTYGVTYALLKALEANLEKQSALDEQILIQNNKLNNLRLILGKYAKYLHESTYEIERKIQTLKNYHIKANQQLNSINGEITQINEELQQLEYSWNLRQNKIGQVKKILLEFDGDLECLRKSIKEYEQEYDYLTNLENSLQPILQQVQAFLSQGEYIDLQKDESLLKEDIEKHKNEIELFNKLISDIENLKTKHTTIQSNLMTTYLSGYSEIIDKLFMQISPHAIYRHVHLVPRDGNLYIVMSEKSSNEEDLSLLSKEELEARFNASLTFSSGQASVLAVCIFLALNQGQNWTKLKFLGVDDPFQNMDDVNVFSFIDVLSQMLLEKQLFISTHSKEFTALMRAKIGVPDDKIGYINFQSYSSTNVVFETNCNIKK